MVAGFERYYQIARCFRDEDLRADRQPDFTQLDIEMSFVDVDDVIEVNERLLAHVFERVGGPVDRAADASACPTTRRWAGSAPTGPTLRFGLELVDLGDALAETEFKVFRSVIESGGAVRGLNAGRRELPRSELDGLISRAQELGAKGLVWAFREGDGWRSPTAKFLTEAELDRAQPSASAPRRATCCCSSPTSRQVANAVLGQLRARPRRALRPDPRGRATACVWIVDWPLIEWNEEEERWDPLHHPFTAPAGEFDPDNPGAARAHRLRPGLERPGDGRRLDPHPSTPTSSGQVFAALGIDAEEAEARFGFLLEALRYGAPPHGGIAYGLDRIVQRLAGADSIRDVIAFPKTASGADALTGAPAPVDEMQLQGARHRAAPARPRRPLRGPDRANVPMACSTACGRLPRPSPGPGADAGPRRRPGLRQLGGRPRLRRPEDGARLAPGAGRGGIEAVLTADWPLDRFGRGDIALRVRGEDWSEAELLLSNLDASWTETFTGPRPTVLRWARGSSPYESRLTV